MALSFSVFNKFKAVDEVSAPMRKMENSVGKFGNKAQKSFKKADAGAGRFSRNLKNNLKGLALTAVGLTAITAGLVNIVQTGVLFEQTIVNASAKFGETAKRGTANFKALEEAARKAGATTEFAATEAAAGLDFLAMAGFNVEQSIAALPGVIDLATASGLDLARATDIATDTLGAFNLQTKDTIQLQKNLARVNDVLAKTTTSSNTNMEQLFEVFTEAGPIAEALGANIETVAAAAGTLANAGIKGSQAGTTLKNVFTRLAAATPAAEKQLKKLGITLDDGKGKFRDVFDILDDLNGSLEKLGEVERAAVLNDIFGKIPIAGVNVLLKAGGDNLRKFRKELEAAGGASAEMAKTMRATTGVQLKIFMSTLESLKLNIFAAMSDSFGIVIADVTELVRVSAIWVAQNQGAIKASLSALVLFLGQMASVIRFTIKAVKDLWSVWGPTITLVLGVVVALKAFAAIMTIVNIIMTANPVGIFIVALAALTLGIKAVIDNWDGLVLAFKDGLKVIMNLPGIKQFLKLMSMGPRAAMNLGRMVRGEDQQPSGAAPAVGPLSPNTAMATTIREERNNSSTVDVNFNNLPQNTKVAQTGSSPGFTLNTGFAGAS